MALFSASTLGIDLGTSRTSVFLEGRGLCLCEPTLLLVSQNNPRDVLAVGAGAFDMLERAANGVKVISPVVSGAVADADMVALVILSLAEKATGRRKPLDRLQLLASLSMGSTNVERAALFSAMNTAGAKRPMVMRAPLAAAMGAGLKLDAPRGQMIVDIGAGTTEIAVITMGGVAASATLRYGGQALDEAVARYFRREKNLIIGLRTAEELKCDLGTAMDLTDEGESAEVSGIDAVTALPHTITATSRDVREALRETLYQFTDAMRAVLEDTEPELAADVLENGVTLTGCGALLHRLDDLIYKDTGVTAHVARHPADCVAVGLGALAGSARELERALLLGLIEE